MKNSDIAKVFSDIADLLEIKGENQFKVRAYQRATRTIEHLPVEVEQMVKEGQSLEEIPGVGEAIAKKTMELVTTGHLHYYDELRAEFPEGISTFLDIPGIGPRIAIRLCNELGVKLTVVTDAHSTSHLDLVRFGVGMARRGWCEAKHILNTRPLEEVLAFLRR